MNLLWYLKKIFFAFKNAQGEQEKHLWKKNQWHNMKILAQASENQASFKCHILQAPLYED